MDPAINDPRHRGANPRNEYGVTMTHQAIRKFVFVYLILTFGASSIFYILISAKGGLEGGGISYIYLLMWTPGVAALATSVLQRRNLRDIGWRPGKPVYYVIAYMLPILYAGIVYTIVWSSGLGRLNPDGLGENWLLVLAINLTAGIPLSAMSAAGEEIGWRGYLVPQLSKLQPFGRTALFSGIIWGIWHVPLIIAGGYRSNAPVWYSVLCFMVLVTGMSFAFAWLRLSSGSVWPVVLMHSVHNTVIQGVLDKITVDTGHTEFLTTEFGLGLALMGIVVGLIFWSMGRKMDFTPAVSDTDKM